MRYILEGNEEHVRNVLAENRLRVEWGVIKFTPIPDADLEDTKNVSAAADTKDVKVADSKNAKKK